MNERIAREVSPDTDDPGTAEKAQSNPPRGSDPAANAYWWVNHQQTYRQELDGEYLWLPKTNRNGTNNVSYDNMVRVLPGDVVFSFADAAIRAVGVALGRAREAAQPAELGKAGEQWGVAPGWQVPVRFRALATPLRPKAHREELLTVLPKKHSPIRASGDSNQRVYLAAVPESMSAMVRELLGRQFAEAVAWIRASAGFELADDQAEERIEQRIDIGPAQKVQLVKARRGQGLFRENLERVELGCRLTGLLDRRHLRATHIKPWCLSEDAEKLDGCNGLLLSPHIGHLFDRGYISFSDRGDLLLSRDLNPAVLEKWGITPPRNVGAFGPEQCRYLQYHRTRVFDKTIGGRRRVAAEERLELIDGGEPAVLKPAE